MVLPETAGRHSLSMSRPYFSNIAGASLKEMSWRGGSPRGPSPQAAAMRENDQPRGPVRRVAVSTTKSPGGSGSTNRHNASTARGLADEFGEALAEHGFHALAMFLRYRTGERQVEAEFVKDVRVTPRIEVRTLARRQPLGPPAGDLVRHRRRAEGIEGADDAIGESVDCDRVAVRGQREERADPLEAAGRRHAPAACSGRTPRVRYGARRGLRWPDGRAASAWHENHSGGVRR